MKIALIMPTYFAPDSVIAGGERYAWGLAKALSLKADTTLISFAKENKKFTNEELKIEYSKVIFKAGGIANPFSLHFLKSLKDFDVIHCLQYKTLVTEFAILSAMFNKKKAFVTDLAGGTHYCLSRVLPVWKGIREFLLISEFNYSLNLDIKRPHRIIYGGVDTEYFCPGNEPAMRKDFLYVGRIFYLKGIHDLIAGFPQDGRLEVAGQCCEPAYLADLKQKASGKNIVFNDSPPDALILKKYQSSLATILPSLVDGGFTSAMESMACGTPVIATRVGSIPEIVKDGITGFLVPPRDPQALREKILHLQKNPQLAVEMGIRAREHVLKNFTWHQVAERCLDAYRS